MMCRHNSAEKAWAVGLAVGLLWVIGSAIVTRQIWEPTPIKTALVVTAPAVLIVMVVRYVLQRRGGRDTDERGKPPSDASE